MPTPIKVKKLGHFVYEVSDIERSTRFWTELLGFQFSDRNEPGMIFLHNATDHHSIALVPSKHKQLASPDSGLRFHHLAMEVDDVDALFKARAYLRDHGIPITYEGRRGPGGNIGIEFTDPDGYQFELYADMDQIGTDGCSRPAAQWSRATTLEDALERPLPAAW
jgi:catechol 2,3-dioxygenase-like lactoylglutathione lyase family enzyme